MGGSCSTKSTCCTTDDVPGHDENMMPPLKTAIANNVQPESDSDDDDSKHDPENSSTTNVCHIS